MNQLELLKSMWAAKTKIKRKTDLIVPQITYKGNAGSLNVESWFFKIQFAFREALDIKYEERMKNKKPYMVWTQGPFLSFKKGDLIKSNDGTAAIQVEFAKPISWDSKQEKMYQGKVIFSSYSINNGSYIKNGEYNCSQMQFLKTLIDGLYETKNLLL